MKVLVIGGGASGLTAALTASEDPHSDVHLAERQARVARKLLATGNGRCNLTNRDMDLSHYHGTAPQFCLPALEAFGVEQTLAWFRSMGLLTVTEPGGRVYPASDSANSVADVLRLTLAGRQNVTLHAGCEITELRRTKGGFSVRLGDESCLFDRVIVCAGGAAGGVVIDGESYMGYLSIPVLKLELPVMSDWDYAKLKIAPCRYFGSAETDDLVICAHNFDRHFGRLKNLRAGDLVTFTDADGVSFIYEVKAIETLQPTQISEMIQSEYDLSLYTCTYGGRTRVTVRCSRTTI